MKFSLRRIPLSILCAFLAVSARAGDPQLESWQTGNSRRYARLYQTDAAKAAGTAVTTWSRGAANQSVPSYAGVIQVSSSANWVYLRASGLGYHVMGPWYLNAAHTQDFPNFPANTGVLYRIPRTPSIPATKTLTGLGAVGYFVDGVSAFDNRDAFSYATASGTDASPVNGLRGDGVWNREAYANEGVTFDPAFAHQAMTNYHYHANAPALRFQLGDHVTYNATTKTYAESTAPATIHSPIVAWMADGLPVYGPYGYSSPMNAASGVRRMISGYVKRDGASGTTNLAATGRTTLPAWAARAQSRSATLTASVYGPAVSTTYPLGNYIEDYDYLGDLGKTQGTDFDLNDCNVRFCVTPEFPNGTYAYFLTIETDGTPRFPNMIGRWFYGSPTGGSVTSVSESVTEYVRASQASAIRVSAVNTAGTVMLTWASVEGATYKVETSPDAATWSLLAGAVTSGGGDTTSYSTATIAANYRVTVTALAAYDTSGAGGLSGVGNSATAAPVVGTTGTVRLVNISSRSPLGGTAGTPIIGFVIGGAGSQPMLVRAVGPTLSTMNVSNPLADPSLRLVANGATIATNDNWNAADAALFSSLGAFALGAASKDAALAATLPTGVYSAPVSATDSGSGVTLLEVYDAGSSTSAAQLVNLSSRAYVSSGDQVLIAGFVITGSGSVRLLVRGVGPGLTGQGVGDAMADPEITLYQSSTIVAANDNWSASSDAVALSAAATQAGAFALAGGSRDAALLATLPAGLYSVVVSGHGGAVGTALAELYLLP
jgi:hypothetical protein